MGRDKSGPFCFESAFTRSVAVIVSHSAQTSLYSCKETKKMSNSFKGRFIKGYKK